MAATFADFLLASDREETVLLEMEPSQSVSGFTATPATSNTYQTAYLNIPSGEVITGGVYRDVTRVRVNGTDLTEKTSISTVEATSSTWWHDTANGLLYVHTSSGADPDTFTVLQVFVRFYFSTSGVVLDSVDGDGDTGIYYHPWVIGDMPDLVERDDEATLGVKTTAGGSVTLLNGHEWWNAVVAVNSSWNWKNKTVSFLIGGSYQNGNQVLTRDDYSTVMTLLVDDITSTRDEVRIELKPLARRMDVRVPKTPFFASSYPNLGDGVKGTKKWIGYGRTIMSPDLTDTTSHGVYTVADAASQTLYAITTVWAQKKDTGTRTQLSISTDYTQDLTACTVTVVNATYAHADYSLVLDVTGKPDGGSSYLSTFGEIVRDILETHIGISTSDIDTTSFATADTDAPEELSVWIKSPRAVSSILSTSQDGLPSLEGSVMGNISQSTLGKWTADIWDPSFTASTTPTVRQDEFSEFVPRTTLRHIYGEVSIHYNRDHSEDEWDIDSATDTKVQFETDTDDVLDIWTFLRASTAATILAQRRLLIVGGIHSEVEFQERGVRLATSRVRDRLLVSYDPAPDASGAFVDAAVELQELYVSLRPTLTISGVFNNLRGVGQFIGRWSASSAPAWTSATDSEKSTQGFWCDSSGQADSGDPLSVTVSTWW